MDKIKRFIECTVPITACNLRCSYCYIIQENRRNQKLDHKILDPRLIGLALRKERLGGTCYISLCGAGETMLHNNLIEVAEELLKQGHYINITTNGTISSKIREIRNLDTKLLERLHFAFSLHYLELIRLNLLEEFFKNVLLVRDAGCSFIIQINLCDEYIPYLDEMKNVCIDSVGAMPQVAVTRNEKTDPITVMSELSMNEYANYGKLFDSPLFEFTLKNFMVKRKEFCYAGDWSFKLILATGELKDCYNSGRVQRIYDNINDPIKFSAIGKNCRSPYCVNSSHFMSLGIIPEIVTPSYADLRDRQDAQWYTPKMRAFLNGKLEENNVKYHYCKKLYINSKGRIIWIFLKNLYRIKNIIKRIIYLQYFRNRQEYNGKI